MNWLNEHSQTLSALANAGLLLVWAVYLQLFFREYRHQRRARVLLQQSAGINKDGECILVNMSSAPVDVACILLAVEADGRTAVHTLESLATRSQALQPLKKKEEAKSSLPRRRGPVSPGSSTSLGTFKNLLAYARQATRDQLQNEDMNIDVMDIRVVFFHWTHDKPLAARRRFYIRRGGDLIRIAPETSRTHQLVSWRQRRQAERWYLSVFG